MRRVLVACLAAVVASGFALTLGSADTGTGSLPDPSSLARQILASDAGHFMTSNGRLSLGMLARGDQMMTQGADSQQAASKAAAATKLAQGGEGPGNAEFANVRVNNPLEDTHQTDQTTQSETALTAVGKNVAVGFNDSQHGLLFLTAGADLNGYGYSRDGGATFTDGGVIPNRNGCVNLGDPWLASDRAGAMYYSSLVECPTPSRFGLDIGVSKSTDGGRTWAQLLPVSTSLNPFFYQGDKDAMTVGRDPSNAAKDNVYIAWDDFQFDFLAGGQLNGLPVARSYDGGATWAITYADQIAQTQCPGTFFTSFGQYIGAAPIVDPSNGDLYVAALKIARECPSPGPPGGKGGPGPLVKSIWVFKSVTGGKTFLPGTQVAVVTDAAPPFDMFKLGDGKYMRILEFPTPAIAGGNLYVAWMDGGATGKGPGAGHSHIRLAKSTTGGATWTDQFVTGGTNDQIQPAISGDASGLHILYYQRNPDNTLDVKVANSADGNSFTTRRVSSQSFPGVLNYPQFDPIIAPFYMGDYIANVSTGDSQMFAWGDNRDIVHNFMYTSGRNDPDVFFAAQQGEGDQKQGG